MSQRSNKQHRLSKRLSFNAGLLLIRPGKQSSLFPILRKCNWKLQFSICLKINFQIVENCIINTRWQPFLLMYELPIPEIRDHRKICQAPSQLSYSSLCLSSCSSSCLLPTGDSCQHHSKCLWSNLSCPPLMYSISKASWPQAGQDFTAAGVFSPGDREGCAHFWLRAISFTKQTVLLSSSGHDDTLFQQALPVTGILKCCSYHCMWKSFFFFPSWNWDFSSSRGQSSIAGQSLCIETWGTGIWMGEEMQKWGFRVICRAGKQIK